MDKPEQVWMHGFFQRCQAVFPDHIGRDTAKPLFARLGFGHGLPYQNGAEMQGLYCKINE